MFICNECGYVFDEPATFSEHHPYGSGTATETFACCPSCKGPFDEAVKCSSCGEYFAEEDLEDGMCADCIKEDMKYYE